MVVGWLGLLVERRDVFGRLQASWSDLVVSTSGGAANTTRSNIYSCKSSLNSNYGWSRTRG